MTSPKEIGEKMEKVAVHLDKRQLEKLDRLLSSPAIMRLLIWMEALDQIGKGVGKASSAVKWLASGVKNMVTALVWIIVPFIVLKMIWAGELNWGDIIKWFAK
jgi:hypothetical protein